MSSTTWQSSANVSRYGEETDWYLVAISPEARLNHASGQTLKERGTFDQMLRIANALQSRNPDVEYHVNRGGHLGARVYAKS